MPSIRNNVIFNYAGQFYVAIVGILTLPLYLQYMGAEAYGLVGFFTLLQAWVQLLDMGLSPTLAREVARLHESVEDAHRLREVVRTLEVLFVFAATLLTLPLFLARHSIADHWLTVHDLDLAVVSTCVGLMILMLGIRWLAALHRSGINAYERQVWMNMTNMVMATLRFPGSLLLVMVTDGSVLWFFGYQLLVSVLEVTVITTKFYRLLPATTRAVAWFNPVELKRLAPFAASIGYTTGIWIFITQLDKLLLSTVLTLAHYGYFSLIATVAAGVMMLSWPVSTALMPRMTALLAKGQEDEMLEIYRKATRLVACVAAPVTIVLACFSAEVVYVWTGDQQAASWSAGVLPLYIIGYGLLTVEGFQYYLQYAHGNLRLHVQFNSFVAALSIPLIAYAAFRIGPVGTGWVWLGFRLVSIAVWTPFVHRTFAPGLHPNWLVNDVLAPIGISLLLLALPLSMMEGNFPADRTLGLLTIVAVIGITTVATLLACFSHEIRNLHRARLQLR